MEGTLDSSEFPESRKPDHHRLWKFTVYGMPQEPISDDASLLFELLASKLNCAILDALIDEYPRGLKQSDLVRRFKEADLRYSTTAISESMKLLRSAGLISRDRGSRSAIYYVEDMASIASLLRDAELLCARRHDRAKHRTRENARRHAFRVEMAELQEESPDPAPDREAPPRD